VTDINLRGTIDGWEVARQAREIDRAFPIVYMTGAAADQWASHGVPNSILLTKPFAPAQLVTAVPQRGHQQREAASVGGLFQPPPCRGTLANHCSPLRFCSATRIAAYWPTLGGLI
jgi:DNA-binding response OmpR family regulator